MISVKEGRGSHVSYASNCGNGYEGRSHLSFILMWKLFSCGNSTLKGSQISGVRDASPGAWGVVYERGGQLFNLVPGRVFDRHAGGARQPERVD